jgi:triacylglycerol lipase
VSNSNTENTECVILLHGMGRTAFSMQPMEKYLQEHGYLTINRSYPSTSRTIEEIANNIIPEYIEECKKEANKIHFVTHSLGGIIIRYYLQSNSLPEGSRVVLLCPPNKGSEIADRLRDSAWYKWLTGPAGQQITTDSNSVPNKLKSIACDVGVITGKRTLEPWFSRLIPGEDDGKVSVENARLAEMKDFLVVDHSHTFIMNSDDVKKQVVNFLRHGYFNRPPKEIKNGA